MPHLDTIISTGLVSPDAALDTYTEDNGRVHLAEDCVDPGVWTRSGSSPLQQLAALPEKRRCRCFDDLACYERLIDRADRTTLAHLAGSSYAASPAALRVSRLRHRAWLLSNQRTPQLTAPAHAAAAAAVTLAETIRGTGQYRADAGLQLLKSMVRRDPGTRMLLQHDATLSLLPAHLHDPLAATVDAVLDEAGDDLVNLAHTPGSEVDSCTRARTAHLERVWEVARDARAWCLLADISPMRPNAFALGVTDSFDPRGDAVRFVRVPLAALWSRTRGVDSLQLLTLDGSRTLDQVMVAARICGDRLDDVEDTLAALDAT